MYLYHFGLRELPFTIAPNTHFYYQLQSHQAALDVLLTALKTGEGFIKVVGEVGTGKTLLCRKLLMEMPDHFVTVYVPDPYLNPSELREAIARELQIPFQADGNQQQLASAIQQRLMAIHREGRSVAILIDEAQALPSESLEALRLLSNVETESRKLVHIVLFGQPELDERLATRALRQLRQRISFSYNLAAMSRKEMTEYIAHRLRVAGYKGPPIFSSTIVNRLYRSSRGIPRLINILCHKMLLLAYGEGRVQVTTRQFRLAVKDTTDAEQPRLWRGVWWMLLGLAAVAAAIGWYQGWWHEYY
ncbi:AAA family ATPase [Idiomarina tyrosinivorans]|uniref:AAA family ATPase n=1 Tax=Idiomarina tyrosinivorans TaxID=1445662 RepID=A0A432ZQM2_9GAMM|nr:AAA family ATPase [Idiomarina tyrosinivorans]RUO80142.1 AAA family ATPase [Idiomarina tyrosinivorans]